MIELQSQQPLVSSKPCPSNHLCHILPRLQITWQNADEVYFSINYCTPNSELTETNTRSTIFATLTRVSEISSTGSKSKSLKYSYHSSQSGKMPLVICFEATMKRKFEIEIVVQNKIKVTTVPKRN